MIKKTIQYIIQGGIEMGLIIDNQGTIAPKKLLRHLDIVTRKSGEMLIVIIAEDDSYITSLNIRHSLSLKSYDENLKYISEINADHCDIIEITDQKGSVKWEDKRAKEILKIEEQIRVLEEKRKGLIRTSYRFSPT